MKKFDRFGFRRDTHDKNGKFRKDKANIWQAHMWNRSICGFIGKLISSRDAQPFDEIVKVCQEKWNEEEELETEEIAMAIVQLIECGLVVVEQTADYETDLYDDEVKFWK